MDQHAVSYHLVIGDVVHCHKLFAVMIIYIAAQMATRATQKAADATRAIYHYHF
jgi:hypothetical protein